LLVEAGGQDIHGFRHGLDYAFVRAPLRSECVDAERVIAAATASFDPSIRPGSCRRRVYESLQGRPEVGPLPTPRRCHAAFSPKAPSGFADVSSVLIQTLRPGATH
jgi:hypothetical protein